MLEIEAKRVCEILLRQDEISPLLNLGSSTLAFRRDSQPHVERCLFELLRQAGITVVHCDLKPGPGVDIAGDVGDPAVMAGLKKAHFRSILIANMFEHVRDRKAVAAACEDIVGSGGLILATVPRSYPYHADPVDTLYRPSREQLAGLFRHSELILTEELAGQTYARDLRQRGSSPWREAARTALWLLIAWARPRSFLSMAHRWFWLRRPYRVSLVLVRVR